MITDRTLANLRTSAALALLVPGISIEASVGDRVIVEAARPPFRDVEHPVLPICAFHRSVVRAHELRRNGTRVEMVGLDGGLEPEIRLRCDPEISIVPGGVVRRSGESWLHLCALSLAVDAVEAATAAICAETGTALEVHLHADRSLDVTIVVTDTPTGDKTTARAAVDLIEAIAARATIDSLVDLVHPAETDWDEFLLRAADEPSAGSAREVRRRP